MKKLVIMALALCATVALSAQERVVSFTASKYFPEKEKYGPVWPFANHKNDVRASVKEATFVGEEVEMILSTPDGPVSFYFFGTKGIVRNSRGGVMWGGANTDYVKFPAIPGKELVKIEIKSGKDLTRAPYLVGEKGEPVEGGSAVTAPVAFDQVIVWTPSKLGKGKTCKLVNNTGAFMGIREIKLTYK
ncbi:MAG: hypothetical protein IJ799_04400 [Bacteroidales bacterium]|nr:hypothetical protein [Bacteroidales bacterium]